MSKRFADVLSVSRINDHSWPFVSEPTATILIPFLASKAVTGSRPLEEKNALIVGKLLEQTLIPR